MGGERRGQEKTERGREWKGRREERGGGRGREMALLTQFPGSAPNS